MHGRGIRRVLAGLTTVLTMSTACQAAPSNSLRVQILPLDCLFEVVNDGLNTVNYLTPAQCGQIVKSSPSDSGETPANIPFISSSSTPGQQKRVSPAAGNPIDETSPGVGASTVKPKNAPPTDRIDTPDATDSDGVQLRYDWWWLVAGSTVLAAVLRIFFRPHTKDVG